MILNPLTTSVRYRDGFPVLPGAFPVVGHVLAFRTHGPELIERGLDTLGPLFWFNFGGWVLLCCGPESFPLLKSKAMVSAPTTERFALFFGKHAIPGQDGAVHRHLRSAMNPPFSLGGLTRTGVGALTRDLICERVEGWAEQRRVAVFTDIQRLTLNIIFRLMAIPQENIAEWHAQYFEIRKALWPIDIMFPGSPHYQAAQARRWLDAQYTKLIAAARNGRGSGGLVSALAHSRDDDDRLLSEEELIDNLRFLVNAGFETTASVLSWMMLTLARRPELWDALCQEAGAQAGVPGSPEEARRFPFAEALFRETLRLYPPVYMAIRRTTDWVSVHHDRIPPGTTLAICVGSLGRDPGLYPDPERLDPARWLGRDSAPTPIETVQFGGGPHFCMGYHLALLEAVQFAVALARTMSGRGLRPRLPDGPVPRPLYVPLTHPDPRARVVFEP